MAIDVPATEEPHAEEGIFGTKELDEKKQGLIKAAAGDLDSLHALANDCLDLWDKDRPANAKAIRIYEYCAGRGHAPSQAALGMCYLTGQVVPESYQKAVKLFQLAANQSDTDGLTYLGQVTLEGVGIRQDTEKGLDLLMRASAQSGGEAAYDLARYYRFETEDLAKAVEYCQLAVRRGHDPAGSYTRHLGEPSFDSHSWHWGPAFCEGRITFGWCYDDLQIGYCYETGRGVPVDPKKAATFYFNALSDDYTRHSAQYRLALLYERGVGVKKDLVKAVRFYNLASQKCWAAELRLQTLCKEIVSM